MHATKDKITSLTGAKGLYHRILSATALPLLAQTPDWSDFILNYSSAVDCQSPSVSGSSTF